MLDMIWGALLSIALSFSLALFLFQFFIVIDGCVGTPPSIPGGTLPPALGTYLNLQ